MVTSVIQKSSVKLVQIYFNLPIACPFFRVIVGLGMIFDNRRSWLLV